MGYSQPTITRNVASPLLICQRESYSLSNSKRLASANWLSRFENIIHRTKRLTPSFVLTSVWYGCVLPVLSCRYCLRPASFVQNKAMCLAVSCLAVHWHFAVTIPGTLRLYRNFARPICLVRAWTRRALSALRRFLWSFRTCSVGGGSSGTTWLFPGSALGRTIRPSLLFSACHLSFQSRRTSFFSCQSYCCSGLPTYSST